MQKRIALPLLFIGLLVCGYASAQVKIGDNPQTIDPASVLELESSERVLVITRVDSLQMANIAPSRGALVYNTSADCVFYYNGTDWINLCGGTTGGDVGDFTTDAIANEDGVPTIVITPTATGNNFEVAPNSISTDQITNGSIFAEDLNLGALDGELLVENSITQNKLSENSVGILALDENNIDLSDFNNTSGFIREADIISGDAGNAIGPGGDGGAFYDDSELQSAINENTAAIAADGDTDAGNELQNLTFDAGTRTISLSQSSETVTLPAAVDEVDGDVENELITASVVNGTTLTITEGGTTFDIPLGDLEGLGEGGGGGAGTDDQTAIEVPVSANPANYTPTSADVEGHLAGIDLVLATGGGEGTDDQTAAEVVFTPAGNTISADVQAAIEELQTEVDGIITTGGGNQNLSQVLTQGNDGGASLIKNILDPVDAQDAATRAYVDAAVTTGSGGLANGNILIGNASGAAQPVMVSGDATFDNTGVLTIAEDAITLEKLNQMGAVDGQVLKWNQTNTAWEPAADNGGSSTFTAGDALTLDGNEFDVDFDGTTIDTNAAEQLQIADGAVTSGKIANATIALEDLSAMGAADGQVLKWNQTNTAWEPAADNGGSSTFTAGDALTLDGNEFDVDFDGTTIDTNAAEQLQIADGAVTSGKIANATIALEDLSAMGAADGQVLKWNQTNTAWEPAADNGGSSTFTAGDALTLDGNEFDVDFDGTTIDTNAAEQLQIADGAVTSGKIANATIALEDLSAMGAADGQVLKWNQTNTAWEPAADNGGSSTFTAGDALTLDGNEFDVDFDGTTIDTNAAEQLQIADGAVTSGKIANATIALEDLSAMGAADGQVLKWNQANTAWEPATDNGGSNTYTDGAGLTLSATNDFSVNVDDTTLEITTDILRIKDDGITDLKLDKDNIPLSGFSAPTADVALGGFKITNLATPTLDQDAATKEYVDDNAGSNLSNSNLEQNEAIRTYEVGAGEALVFTGPGDIGFGNGANPPLSKFHFAGEVRVEGVNSADGTMGNPAYTFSGDTGNDTGMYRPAADQIGFSVGGFEALRIEEPSNGINKVVVNQSLELDGLIIDFTNTTGSPGNILTVNAAGNGVEWAVGGTTVDTDTDKITGNGSSTNPLTIANDAITSAELAGDAVTTNQIAAKTILSGDIGDGEIKPINIEIESIDSGLIEDGQVRTEEITDGTITDDDINDVANIAGTKINPDFGANDILTTGNIDIGGSVTVAGTLEHPDYVFQKYFLGNSELKADYDFKTLKEIETFIKKHHHLPGIKSAAEVKKDGSWNLSESNLQNLEKIEELYLHTIEQEKKIDQLESEKEVLSKEVRALRKDLDEIKAMLKKAE